MQSDIDALDFNLRQTLDRVLWLQDWTKTRWTITIIIAIAITLFCVIVFIRQQKIMRKLDEIAKKTEEPTTEDKP